MQLNTQKLSVMEMIETVQRHNRNWMRARRPLLGEEAPALGIHSPVRDMVIRQNHAAAKNTLTDKDGDLHA